MRKILFFLITFLLLGAFPISAQDKLPKRVISLSPAITEIIYAIGREDHLIGVTNYCTFPEEATSKEKVGGFITPNIEKIVSLEPDLVILSPNSGTKLAVERLTELNIQTKVVSFYSIDEIKESLEELSDVFYELKKTKQILLEMDQLIHSIEEKTNEVEKPKVLFIRWHLPISACTQSSLEGNIIELAGGENLFIESKTRYININIEPILKKNPDIIIDASYYNSPDENQKESIRSFWKKWDSVNAVKNKQVYLFNEDFHSVPGIKTQKLIKAVASIFHPTLFDWENKSIEKIYD